jgi:hypothetical protein
MLYNVFGSPDGQDMDVLVLAALDTVSMKQGEIDKMCNRHSTLLTSEKRVDVNLIVVEDGVVSWVAHGTLWETNNALLSTYHLHQQHYPLFVTRPLSPSDQDINQKIHKTARYILSMYTRCREHRTAVKTALLHTTPLLTRLKTIESIITSEYQWMDTRDDIIRIRRQTKRATHQVLQSLHLLQGRECYTKQDLLQDNALLRPFLYREDTTNNDYTNLEATFGRLLDLIHQRSQQGLIDLSTREIP